MQTQQMKRQAVIVALKEQHSDTEIAHSLKVVLSFVVKVQILLEAADGDPSSVDKWKKSIRRVLIPSERKDPKEKSKKWSIKTTVSQSEPLQRTSRIQYAPSETLYLQWSGVCCLETHKNNVRKGKLMIHYFGCYNL